MVSITFITGGFTLQMPMARSFAAFFDLLLNKRWSKTIETPVNLDAIELIMPSL